MFLWLLQKFVKSVAKVFDGIVEFVKGIIKKEKKEKRKKLYRNMLVYTYYTSTETAQTPSGDFLDLKVARVSEKPLTKVERDELLNVMNNLQNMFKCVKSSKVKMRVTGEEVNKEIDADEVEGLGVKRYASFKDEEEVIKIYEEEDIQKMELMKRKKRKGGLNAFNY